MNEEEVKVKYVLPWLKQAGVDLNDLQFELTFSVKIGRRAVTVGSKSKLSAGARLDILVRRGDRNLFVVETKEADKSLSDEDRDQAVSYARLVHPVAPYAIVTNGIEYRLYDSITKQRIDPDKIKVRGFDAVLPDPDILEAQRLFLGLNRSNLALFCQQQVASELRLVKGTVDDGKKYVPELHVPREVVQKEISEFYSGTPPGLLLVGQPGQGKTCELCWIAESLIAKGQSVLFFNGFSLPNSLIGAIADEFSWTFGGSDLPTQVVQRLESVLAGETLTIIVDAIDEWESDSRSSQVASILRAAETRKLRIILSCKASTVDLFLSHRGNPTHTSILARRVDLTTLPAREFHLALERYRLAYQFFGGFETTVLKQARENPFLLRVLFDVARNSRVKHLTFTSAQFFEEYYERSLLKTRDRREAAQTLEAVALHLYQLNVDRAHETAVGTALGLRPNESIMEDLFECGLLVRSVGDRSDTTIGFYIQQIRDYVVAFVAMKFNKMSTEQLKREFESTTFPSMRGDVFALYYRLAPRERKLIFDGDLRRNATEYVRCYTALIQENFPALRRSFRPGTGKQVGFIGEILLSQRCVGGYGFRSVKDGEDDVHFVPVDQMMGRSNLLYLDGASTLHFTDGSNGFRDGINIRSEVVNNELLPQIQLLTKEGRLNESNNIDLLAELVIHSVLVHKEIFKSLLTPDQLSIRYPLKLDAILTCIQRETLLRHFKDEIIQRKRQTGEIREHWSSSGSVSYYYSSTPADNADATQKAEQALALGDTMPVSRVRHRDLEELRKMHSAALEGFGDVSNEITAPPIPDWYDVAFGATPTVDTLKRYLRRLYAAYLSNYRTLVDTNFPTLRTHFELYSEAPRNFYIVIGEPTDSDPERRLDIYSVKSDSGRNVVDVVDEVIRQESQNGHVYRIGGTTHDVMSWRTSSVEHFLSRNDRFGEMHLRTLVYSQLIRELTVVERAFRTQSLSS